MPIPPGSDYPLILMKPLERGEDRQPGGEHYAHADGDAERLVLDIAAQAVHRGIQIIPGD